MSMNRPYLSTDELPQTLRLFPLAGALLLPRGELPLNIFEPRYLAMVDAALASDRLLGMVQPAMRPCAEQRSQPLCEVGCAGRLTRLFLPDAEGRRPCHGDDPRFRSDPAMWDQTQQVLVDMGLLKAKLPSEQLFTNQFVDEGK